MDIEFDSVMRVDLIKCNASDEDVARAAWVSNYGEDARTKDAVRIKGLINYLYSNKHLSPFEHGSFTFFVDVPLFVAREFMRHRTFSYNEVSGRYTEMKPRFYVPSERRPFIQKGKIGEYSFDFGDEQQYLNVKTDSMHAYAAAWSDYQSILESGVAREVARNTLSLGLYTQFYATCNPRNLMQFLTLRNDAQALWEIRDTAEQMEDCLEMKMPITYDAFTKDRRWCKVLNDMKKLYTIEQAETMVYAADSMRDMGDKL